MTGNDDLVPHFVPTLAQMLALGEKTKGKPLTEAEVIEIRDKAPCIMVPSSMFKELQEKLGYRDVNPENCWADWHRLRVEFTGNGFLPKIVLCLTAKSESMQDLQKIVEEEGVDFEVKEYDAKMVVAFEKASLGRSPSLTKQDLESIADHTSILFLLSDNFHERDATQFSYHYLRAGGRLLEAGASAMKCESSGIAHSRERWMELAKEAERGAAGEWGLFWSALFDAYVQFPIVSDDDFYSCGMHLLGKPDVIVSGEVMRRVRKESESTTNDVVYLFETFCLYLIAECEDGAFASGNTFQPDMECPSFRVVWEECTGYEQDDLLFNPFGRWRFISI